MDMPLGILINKRRKQNILKHILNFKSYYEDNNKRDHVKGPKAAF